MSVSWQNVEVPFGGGLDTKTHEHLVKSPKLRDLQNGVFTQAPGIVKRNGYTALDAPSATIPANSLYALGTRNDELVALDREYLYSWDGTVWKNKGRLTGVKVSEKTLGFRWANQTKASVASTDTVRVTAWVDSQTSSVKYSVENLSTGVFYTADSDLATADFPRCITVANSVHIYYQNTSTGALQVKVVTSEVQASIDSLPIDVFGNLNAAGIYDVFRLVHDDSTEYGLGVYRDSSDNLVGFLVKENGDVFYGTISGLDCSPTTLATGAATFVALGSSFAFSYIVGAGAVQVVYFNYANLSAGGTTHSLGGANYERLALSVYYDSTATIMSLIVWAQGTANVDYTSWVYTGAAPGVTITDNSLKNVALFSCAFPTHFDANVLVVYRGATATTLQATVFAVNQDRHFWAKLLDGVSLGAESTAYLPSVQVPYNGDIAGGQSAANATANGAADYLETALVWRRRLDTDSDATNDDRSDFFANKGIRLVTFDFVSPDRATMYQVGNTLYIQSGILHQYDGVRLHEAGFLIYPEITNAQLSSSNSTGSLDVDAVYTYRIYYEHTNAVGERSISTTARPVSIDLGAADDTVQITLPHLNITNRPNNSVIIAVYRTEGNADLTAGDPLFRASSPSPADSTYIDSSYTTSTETYTDELVDTHATLTNLISRELDYQNTGELDNLAAPVGHITTYGKDRAFIAGLPDGNEIRYSKLRFPGDALAFNDALSLSVPEDGGAITALDVLNQFLVVFKQDRIYVLSGDGPNNLGQGGFSAAELVTSDVGCSTQKSIVRTPGGLMFLSDKGIYLLTSNLQVSYIGADVEAFNSQEVSAATLLNDVNQVRFLTPNGRTLVFDYQFGQWSTFTNHEGLSATVWQGTYVYLLTDEQTVYVETPGEYTDDGAHYSLRIKTPWLVLGTIQNYMRVRRLFLLGTFLSSHTLKCYVRYDYEEDTTLGSWDPGNVLTGTPYGSGEYGDGPYGGEGSTVYQVRFFMPRQKCEAIQFEFYDHVESEDPGQAYQISALTLEAGIKKGPAKLESARSI